MFVLSTQPMSDAARTTLGAHIRAIDFLGAVDSDAGNELLDVERQVNHDEDFRLPELKVSCRSLLCRSDVSDLIRFTLHCTPKVPKPC